MTSSELQRPARRIDAIYQKSLSVVENGGADSIRHSGMWVEFARIERAQTVVCEGIEAPTGISENSDQASAKPPFDRVGIFRANNLGITGASEHVQRCRELER